MQSEYFSKSSEKETKNFSNKLSTKGPPHPPPSPNAHNVNTDLLLLIDRVSDRQTPEDKYCEYAEA